MSNICAFCCARKILGILIVQASNNFSLIFGYVDCRVLCFAITHLRNYLLNLLTYSLHATQSFLEKLTTSKLVKKFPAFYGTWRFITAFTGARHMPYPQPALSSPSLLLKIRLNIVRPSTAGSSKWSLSFKLPHHTVCL